MASVDTTLAREAATETERLVAWLRLPAIALFLLARSIPHPNPEPGDFYVTLGLYAAWSVGALVWVTLAPAGPALRAGRDGARRRLHHRARRSLGRPVLERAACVLPDPRLGRLSLPARRSRPSRRARRWSHTSSRRSPIRRRRGTTRTSSSPRYAGYLTWVGAACVLLSALLARRTEAVAHLADARSRLLADALSAEQRERKALAEGLHDHAVQNLLSALHELEEATEDSPHPALGAGRAGPRRHRAGAARGDLRASSLRPRRGRARCRRAFRGHACGGAGRRRAAAGRPTRCRGAQRPAALLGRARAAHQRRPARAGARDLGDAPAGGSTRCCWWSRTTARGSIRSGSANGWPTGISASLRSVCGSSRPAAA